MLIIVIDLEFEYSGGSRSTTRLTDDEIGFYFKSLIEKKADSPVKRVYVMVYRWDAANYLFIFFRFFAAYRAPK